jgi:hypothetical protein
MPIVVSSGSALGTPIHGMSKSPDQMFARLCRATIVGSNPAQTSVFQVSGGMAWAVMAKGERYKEPIALAR